MFLGVRSVTQTNILVGISQVPAIPLAWKIVLSFSLSFIVMKAHVNNGYIWKIHKHCDINYEKYVRG